MLAASIASAVDAGTESTSGTGACDITQAKSLKGDVATTIKFVNKTYDSVRLVWLNQVGERVPYATLEPGESLNQRTYDTNAWIVLDRAGTCIGYVVAPSRVYTIEGPAAVNVTVGGPGVVEGGGIECGGSRDHCSLSDQKWREPVTLHAVPGPGARFVGWSAGGCVVVPNSNACRLVFQCAAAASPSCTVTPTSANSGDAQVTATFALTSLPAGKQPFRLTLRKPLGRGYPGVMESIKPAVLAKACNFSQKQVSPSGCGASVASGTAVTLSAAPDFLRSWQGSCVGTADVCRLIVDGPTEAIYVVDPNMSQGTGFAVTVSVVGGGKVTGSGIDCRSKCTINNLEVLELTATHDAGHQFLGWSGTPCARFRNKAQCQVALTDKAKVTATFSR